MTQNIPSILWTLLLNVLWFEVNCHKDSGGSCKMMTKSALMMPLKRIFQDSSCWMAVTRGCHHPFTSRQKHGPEQGVLFLPSVAQSALKPIKMTLEKGAVKLSAFLVSHGKLQRCLKKLCFKTCRFTMPVGKYP